MRGLLITKKGKSPETIKREKKAEVLKNSGIVVKDSGRLDLSNVDLDSFGQGEVKQPQQQPVQITADTSITSAFPQNEVLNKIKQYNDNPSKEDFQTRNADRLQRLENLNSQLDEAVNTLQQSTDLNIKPNTASKEKINPFSSEQTVYDNWQRALTQYEYNKEKIFNEIGNTDFYSQDVIKPSPNSDEKLRLNDKTLKKLNDKYGKVFVDEFLENYNFEVTPTAKDEVLGTQMTFRFTPKVKPEMSSMQAGTREEYNDRINILRQQQRLIDKNQNISSKTAINRIKEKTIELYQAPTKQEGTGITNAFKGTADVLFDRDTWTAGVTEWARSNAVKNAAERFKDEYQKSAKLFSDRGDRDWQDKAKKSAFANLSENDRELITAYMDYIEAGQIRANDMSLGYKIGQTIGTSAGFMVNMLIGSWASMGIKSGVKAATKGTTKGIGKAINNQVRKSIIRDQLVDRGLQVSKNATFKETLRASGKYFGAVGKAQLTSGRAAITTATNPRTYSNINEKIIDKYLKGEDFTFGDVAAAVVESHMENWSEIYGGKLLKPLFKPIFRTLPEIKFLTSATDQFNNTTFGRSLIQFNNNKLNRFLKERAYFSDSTEEFQEEYVGSAFTSLYGLIAEKLPFLNSEYATDMKSNFSDMFSGEETAQLFGSIIPMELLLKGVPLAMTYRNEQRQERLQGYKDAITDLRTALQGAGFRTPNRLIDTFEKIIATDDVYKKDNKGNPTNEFSDEFSELVGATVTMFDNADGSLKTAFDNYIQSAKNVAKLISENQAEFSRLTPEQQQQRISEMSSIIQQQATANILYNNLCQAKMFNVFNSATGEYENRIMQLVDEDGGVWGIVTDYDKDSKTFTIIPEYANKPITISQREFQQNNLHVIHENVNNLFSELSQVVEPNSKEGSYIHTRLALNDFIEYDGQQAYITEIQGKDGASYFVKDLDNARQTGGTVGVKTYNPQTNTWDTQIVNVSDLDESTANRRLFDEFADETYQTQKDLINQTRQIAQELSQSQQQTEQQTEQPTNNTVQSHDDFTIGQTYDKDAISRLKVGDKITINQGAKEISSEFVGQESTVVDIDNGFITIERKVKQSNGSRDLAEEIGFDEQDFTFTYNGSEVQDNETKKPPKSVGLSDELDENDIPFVKASDGTTTFGEITADKGGLVPAPIRLSEGINYKNNQGYGLKHIKAKHGEQILNAGYESVEAFIEDVAKNFDTIKKGNTRATNDTYLLEITDKHNHTLYIELSQDGSYWNVNSAGIFKKGYSKKESVVWTLPALSRSTNTDATGVTHGTTTGATVTSGNSPQTTDSESKITTKSLNDKIKSGEILSQNAEDTLVELYSQMSKEDAQEVVNGIIKQTEAKQKQLAKKSINYEDIDKFQKHKQQIKDTEKKLAYWNEVKSLFTAPQSQVEEVQNLKSIGEKEKTLGQAYSMREFILRHLALGGKFIWNDSENGTKGLGSHLGLSNSTEERRNYFAFLSGKDKKGVYPEVYAENLLTDVRENINPNAEFDEVFNEMIDCLSSFSKPSEMMDEAVRLHYETEDNLNQNDFEKQQQNIDDRAEEQEISRLTEQQLKENALSPEEYDNLQRQRIEEEQSKNTEFSEDRNSQKQEGVSKNSSSERKKQNGTSQQTKNNTVTDNVNNYLQTIESLKRNVVERALQHTTTLNRNGENVKMYIAEYIDYCIKNGIEIEDNGRFRPVVMDYYKWAKDNYVKQQKVTANTQESTAEDKELLDAVVDKLKEAIGEENVIADNTEAQRILDEANGKDTDRLEQDNQQFNEELQQFKDGQLKNGILHLGKPNELLEGCGLNAEDITLTAKTLKEHLNKHGITPEEIKDLPKAINNPLMVYEWGTKAKSTIIITNITRGNGEKITVAVKVERNGKSLDVNEIASIHGKDSSRFISDMLNAKEGGLEEALKYVQENKKEVLDWLGMDTPEVSASLTNKGPRIAKVIQNFDTEKFLDKNSIKQHKVYHGSPYEFTEFDHSNMGTGEGSQVFGWGSYVTETEEIGKYYAGNNKNKETFFSVRTNGEWKEYNYNKEFKKPLGTALQYLAEEETRQNALRRAESLVKTLKDYYGKDHRDVKFAEQVAEILRTHTKRDFKYREAYSHNLYTVEIPDDNGKNYLHWDGNMGDTRIIDYDKIINELFNEIIKTDESYKRGEKYLRKELSELDLPTGRDLYGTISIYLGSDKKASEFLNKLGFVGISYPTNTLHGGNTDGARNYVIFNEKDLKITDHIKFFKTKDGQAYGFTANGKIYIDTSIAKADTPIHEYTHLWAEALKQNNPEEWKNIVDLMKKEKILWDKIKQDYPELTTDDELAEEVLAHYSGENGKKRLEEEVKNIKANNKQSIFDKAKMVNAVNNVKKALERFWKGVASFFNVHFTSAQDLADTILSDFLNGVNPNNFIKDTNKIKVNKEYNAEEQEIINKEKADGTYMKAPNGKKTNLTERQWVQVRTKAFKDWFGDWENNPENSSKVVDENGEPLVVYHGTKRGVFTVFDTDGAEGTKTEGTGSFFTADRTIADTFSSSSYLFDSDDFNKTDEYGTDNERGGIYAVFLNIKNPEMLDAFGNPWDDIYGDRWKVYNEYGDIETSFSEEQDALDYMDKNAGDESWRVEEDYFLETIDEYVRRNREAGLNDGVYVENIVDGANNMQETNLWIAFTPNQIKSATDNIGTFSKERNDIRYNKAKPTDNKEFIDDNSTTKDFDERLMDTLTLNFDKEDGDYQQYNRTTTKVANFLEEKFKPLRAIDKGHDSFAGVRLLEQRVRLAKFKKSKSFKETHESPYKALNKAITSAYGIKTAVRNIFIAKNYRAIDNVVGKTITIKGKKVDITRKHVAEYQVIKAMADRTAKIIEDRYQRFTELSVKSELTKKEQKELDNILSDMGKNFGQDFKAIYDKISNAEVVQRFEQMKDKFKADTTEDISAVMEVQLMDTIKMRMAAEIYRDDFVYNTVKNGGFIKGMLSGEQDLFKTELYNLFFKEKEPKGTTHTPQEVINEIESYNLDFDSINKTTNKLIEFINKFSLSSKIIDTEEYNHRQLNGDYWVPLRGWDGEMYSVYGQASGTQKTNIRANGRKTVASDPMPYIYAMVESTVDDGVYSSAKRVLKDYLMRNADILKENDETVTYMYRFYPNEKGRKAMNSKRSNITFVEDGKTGFVLADKKPRASWIDNEKSIIHGNTSEITDAEGNKYEHTETGKVEVIAVNEDFNKLNNGLVFKVFGDDKKYERLHNETLQPYIWTFRDTDGTVFRIALPDKSLVKTLNTPKIRFNEAFANPLLRDVAMNVKNLQSKMVTSYSLKFAINNIFKDLPMAMAKEVSNTNGYVGHLRTEFKNIGRVAQYIFNPRGININKMSAKDKEVYLSWIEWQTLGGMSGVSSFYNKDVDNVMKRLEADMDRTKWSKAKKVVGLKYVSDCAELGENLIRFASYRAFIKSGLNKNEAAYQSKEVTLNYSRQGKVSQKMNLFYTFYSATMNACYKLARLLINNPKGYFKFFTFFALVGAGKAIISHFSGDDDKDKSKYTSPYKQLRHLYVPFSDGFYMPFPHEAALPFALGQDLTKCLFFDEINGSKVLYDMTQILPEHLPQPYDALLKDIFKYNQTTGKMEYSVLSKDYRNGTVSTLSPSAITPLVDVLVLNEDFMRGNIIYDNWNGQEKTRAGRSPLYDNTYIASELLAEGYNKVLNWDLMGKNKVDYLDAISDKKGNIVSDSGEVKKLRTLAPEDIQYIAQQYVPYFTGVIGKAVDVGNVIIKKAFGDDAGYKGRDGQGQTLQQAKEETRKDSKVKVPLYDEPIISRAYSTINKEVKRLEAKYKDVKEKDLSEVSKQALEKNSEYRAYKTIKRKSKRIRNEANKIDAEIENLQKSDTPDNKQKVLELQHKKNHLWDDWINENDLKTLKLLPK